MRFGQAVLYQPWLPDEMVKAAEFTVLSIMPGADAMAFRMDEELTATGPLYRLPLDDVGVDPSVV